MTKHNKQKGGSPIVAAVGGVVVGAGLAIAGALALKDKKTGDKVSKVIKDLKSETKDLSKKIQDSTEATKDTVKKIIKESK